MSDPDLVVAPEYDNKRRAGRPKGTPQSPAAIEKIRAAMTGREIGTVWRMRMSAARLRYLARQREAADAAS